MQRTLARRPSETAARTGAVASSCAARVSRLPSAGTWGEAADLLPQAIAAPAMAARARSGTAVAEAPRPAPAVNRAAGHDFRRLSRRVETAPAVPAAPTVAAEQSVAREGEETPAAPTVAAPGSETAVEMGGGANTGSTALPATVTTTYDVGGNTLAEVAQNLPADEAGEAKFVITVSGTTGDPITTAQAQVDHSVQLPRWTERDKQCDRVKQGWDRFLSALSAHENGHIAISRSRLATVHTRFIGIAQSDIGTRMASETAATQAKYDAYDAANGHGVTGSPPTILDTSIICPPPVPSKGAPPDGGTTVAPKRATDADVEGGADVSHVVRQGLSGGGQPLDSASRAFFEPRLGHDLSGIRVHTGSQASQSATQVSARAYAVGGDIAFRDGEYNPGTSAGRHLLAHELAHTVQQGATTPLARKEEDSEAISPALSLSAAPVALSRKITHDTQRLPAALAQTQQAAKAAKAHPPAAELAQTAQNAAAEPPNAATSAANAQQATAINAAPKGQVQKNAFLVLLKQKIAEVTPNNQDDLKKFKSDGRAQRMGAELSQNVQQQSQQAQASVATASAAAPPTPAATRVPGAPPVAPPPPALPQVPAAQAAPPTPPSVAPEAQQKVQDAEKKMADAKITPEQLQKANDPRFSAVADSQKEMRKSAETKPAEVDAAQQARAGQAVAQAGSRLQNAQSQMAGHHAQHHTRALTAAETARQKSEQERKNVADEIEKRFGQTKTAVDKKLTETTEKADKMFSDGKTAEFKNFEDSLDSRMTEYWFEHPLDAAVGALSGLTDGQRKIFANERQIFTTRMDNLIVTIADYVEKSLTETKALVAQGKAEIDAYVAGLAPNLRQVGQEAETALGSRFTELSESVDSAREELASSLADQYNQAQTEMDEREKQFEADHAGLVSGFLDQLAVVMKAIEEFRARLAGVVQDGEATIDLIIADPIQFLNYLLDALKAGFGGFLGNIGTHLKSGLMDWIFGTLAAGGIPAPASFDLKGIGILALNILDVSVDSVINRLMTMVGPMTQKAAGVAGKVVGAGQQVMDIGAQVMPKIMEYVNTFKSGGIEGLWEQIKGDLSGLKDMIIGGIKEWVVSKLIGIAIQKLMTMSNPAGAIIEAVLAIYKTVMFFIEKAQQVMSLVESVVRSVGNIARGNIGGAAAFIEQSMAKAIPLVIGFLADLIGLGGLSNKIQEFVKKAKALVWKGIDAILKKVAKFAEKIIAGAIKLAKKVGKKIAGAFKGKDKKDGKKGEDERTPEQKQVALDQGMASAGNLLKEPGATQESVNSKLPPVQQQHKLKSLKLVEDSKKETEITVHVHGEVSLADSDKVTLPLADLPANAPKEGEFLLGTQSVNAPVKQGASGNTVGGKELGKQAQAFKVAGYETSKQKGQNVIFAKLVNLSLDEKQTAIVEGGVDKSRTAETLAKGIPSFYKVVSAADIIAGLQNYVYLMPGSLTLKGSYQGAANIRPNFYKASSNPEPAGVSGSAKAAALSHPAYKQGQPDGRPWSTDAWLCNGYVNTARGTSAAPHITESAAEVDHVTSIVDHWNSSGRAIDQPTRETWHKTCPKQLLCGPCNGDKDRGKNYQNDVEMAWTGPGGAK